MAVIAHCIKMNSPRFLYDDWPSRAHFSDDAYSHLWRQLLHFAGGDAARRAMSFSPEKNQVLRFRHAIELADTYIQEFEDANELIDAVPFYYGTYWLGMAVAYATLDLNSAVTARHGLHRVATSSPFSLKESFIEAEGSSAVAATINEAFGGENIFGRRFSILELLQALPEMQDDLERMTDCKTTAIKVEYDGGGFGAEGNIILARVSSTFDINEGYLTSRVAVSDYLKANGLSIIDEKAGTIKWEATRPSEFEQLTINAPQGTFFLPKLHKQVIPEFLIYLMVLYQLSNLARYEPESWIPLFEEQSDEYFVIRSFMRVAKEKIPRLALNHLTRHTNHANMTSY